MTSVSCFLRAHISQPKITGIPTVTRHGRITLLDFSEFSLLSGSPFILQYPVSRSSFDFNRFDPSFFVRLPSLFIPTKLAMLMSFRVRMRRCDGCYTCRISCTRPYGTADFLSLETFLIWWLFLCLRLPGFATLVPIHNFNFANFGNRKTERDANDGDLKTDIMSLLLGSLAPDNLDPHSDAPPFLYLPLFLVRDFSCLLLILSFVFAFRRRMGTRGRPAQPGQVLIEV